MGVEKAILNSIPAIHATQLLGGIRKKKKKLLSSGVGAIVGTNMIQIESQFINSF